MTDIYLLLYA